MNVNPPQEAPVAWDLIVDGNKLSVDDLNWLAQHNFSLLANGLWTIRIRAAAVALQATKLLHHKGFKGKRVPVRRARPELERELCRRR